MPSESNSNKQAGGGAVPQLVLPALVGGFATASAMWIVWLVTHLPELSVSGPVAAGLLIASLLVGMILTGRAVGPGRAIRVGLLAGIAASLINLLLLGTELTQPLPPALESPAEVAGDPTEAEVAETVLDEPASTMRPGAAGMAIGFVALGGFMGLAGGMIGMSLPSRRTPATDPARWVGRMAVVAVCATFPLLLLGGLVTSTESGLAVPDWPNSYGTAMFLYPIGLMADPRIFLEHSHRLFGSLVGLTTVVLAVMVLLVDSRRWVKVAALALVAAVIVQGVLGGLRVTDRSAGLAIVHGVVAQLFFAALIAQAAWLSASWSRVSPASGPGPRKLKLFTTGLLHTTIVQLLLGAIFRHLAGSSPGASHVIWTHAAFSLVVVFFAAMAGSLALHVPAEGTAQRPILRRAGKGLFIVIALQFLLGWAALFGALKGAGRGPVPTHDRIVHAETVPAYEVVLTTAHQANGALVLALASLAYVWGRRSWDKRGSRSESA